MKFGKKILTVALTLMLLLGAALVMTVVAGAEGTEPSLRIAYCNLSHKDNVYIKYAVKAENAADVGLLVWTAPAEDYVLGTQDDLLSPLYVEAIGGEDHLIFDYAKLSARQMTDVVYTRAYTEVEGEIYYSEVNKYSILQYAYNMLGKTAEGSSNAKLRQLLKDMLTYGASAQEYAGYKTDRLATMNFYQVILFGGTLDDASNHGLYLPGDQLTLYAPETDGEGGTFAYWVDSNDNKVTLTEDGKLTVGKGNNYYKPVYLDYAEGLEFDSNGDGTCCLVGLGTCTDAHVLIPNTSPAGDIVTEIDSLVFANSGIIAVTIPSSVNYIGRRAFSGCDALTDVYFEGSEEQWLAMDFGSGNEALLTARVHFRYIRVFTVTFEDYDGTELLVTNVIRGAAATPPAAPVREGYVFAGWSVAFDYVIEDMTVRATYTQVSPIELRVDAVEIGAEADTVTVVISVEKNSGLSALQFILDYDERLTPVSVSFNEAFGAYVTTPEPYRNPMMITFISPLGDSYASGEFAVLTFSVNGELTAGEVLPLALTLVEENTMDEDFLPVDIQLVNGSITVQP